MLPQRNFILNILSLLTPTSDPNIRPPLHGLQTSTEDAKNEQSILKSKPTDLYCHLTHWRESPLTVGSVGPCPRAPSGGIRVQLRHRERGAEYGSAPSRQSGRRAEGKGTGPGELPQDQRAVFECADWARGQNTRVSKSSMHACRFMYVCCVQILEPCDSVVLNVCRLCVSTCYPRVGWWWGGPRLQCRAESSRRREIGLKQTHYGKQLPGRGSGPAGPAARGLGRKLPGWQESLDV